MWPSAGLRLRAQGAHVSDRACMLALVPLPGVATGQRYAVPRGPAGASPQELVTTAYKA